jgi:adenine-specific DNA-methyltransferase
MIATVPSLPKPREAGVVYTKTWMVELVLDLAGYLAERRLADMVALEPSAGDGAFLRAMVRRLVQSCQLHGIPLMRSADALQAYEIDAEAAARAVNVARAELASLGVDHATAGKMARNWIKAGDFLESSLHFPLADFVIGNPPYIRMEEIPAGKAASYRKGFSAMRGRADIYVAFYQAALRQLRKGGVCAYICADRWMLNDYGSALREFITTEGYAVRYVIEAHDVAAFESDVSAYPAVTVIQRGPQGHVVVAKALPGIETADRSTLVHSLETVRSSRHLQAARFDSWFRGSEPWPCRSPDALRVLKGLEASCLPLESGTTGTRIGIGVATGADRVFITDGEADIERDRLLPLAMASDLRGGAVQWSGHYLINPWGERGLVELDAFPRMRNYLHPHHAILGDRHTARKDRPTNWHKTIDRVDPSLLRKEKLYVADIKDRLLPALDAGETYPHHNLYWITSTTWDLRVLGALLMSTIGEFFIRCYGVRMRGGFFRFQAQYLRRIRVPDPGSISPTLAATLRRAFDHQDMELANRAALQAYRLDGVPT